MNNGFVRLMEAKSGARVTLEQLSSYIRRVGDDLWFNTDYFKAQGLLNVDVAKSALRSGRLEVEIFLNNPESARIAQELLAEMGGATAKYLDDLGVEHALQIIITAVSK